MDFGRPTLAHKIKHGESLETKPSRKQLRNGGGSRRKRRNSGSRPPRARGGAGAGAGAGGPTLLPKVESKTDVKVGDSSRGRQCVLPRMPPHRSSNTNDAPTHTHTQLCSSRDASCTRLAVGGRGPAAGPVIMVLVHPSRVVAPCHAEAPSHACTVWTRALRSSRGVPLSIAATR